MGERWKAINGTSDNHKEQEDSSPSQLEILAMKHDRDYILQPALSFDEKQVDEDEPSLEEDSDNDGNK